MTMMSKASACLAVTLATFIGGAQAFYLPGVAPREFQEGEKIEVKVTKLSSVRTHMPYEYYSMPFCKPDVAESFAENLGDLKTSSASRDWECLKKACSSSSSLHCGSPFLISPFSSNFQPAGSRPPSEAPDIVTVEKYRGFGKPGRPRRHPF